MEPRTTFDSDDAAIDLLLYCVPIELYQQEHKLLPAGMRIHGVNGDECLEKRFEHLNQPKAQIGLVAWSSKSEIRRVMQYQKNSPTRIHFASSPSPFLSTKPYK